MTTGIERGRYLYCVVRDSAVEDAAETFDVTGVDDQPVRLVRADGVAAVVHDCESLYDSSDTTTIQRWLLQHQGVVDDAGDAFGTPLPVRFDTILRGGDDRVREWLSASAETLGAHLENLRGRWEYRIEVFWNEQTVREAVAAEDEAVRSLQQRAEEAGEGTRFLLEKQVETKLDRRVGDRRDRLADDVAARLHDRASEVRSLGARPSVDLGVERPDGDGDGDDLVARFAVLATDDEEQAVGDALDDIVGDGVSVRYTGPWPPYTFAPSLEDDAPDAPDQSDGDVEHGG